MDLRKLNHAVALAEEGTFAAAAKRLHLSQPALSRSIQALEADLGVRLFDRHPSGVWLTVPGRLLLQQARDLLRSANNLRREAELIKGVKQGNLNIGLGPVPAQIVAPILARQLLNHTLNIRIHTVIQHHSHLLELLLDESIELFIAHTHGLSEQASVTVQPIGRFKLGFFVAGDHPLLRCEPVPLQLLHQYPLASHTPEDPRTYSQITSQGLLEWPRQLTSDSILALKASMTSTDIVLLTAWALVQDEVASGELVPITTEALHSPPYFEIGIVHLAGRSLSPLAAKVAEAVRKCLHA